MELISFILGVWIFITGNIRFAGKTPSKFYGRLLGVIMMLPALFVFIFPDFRYGYALLIWGIAMFVYVLIDQILTERLLSKSDSSAKGDVMEGKEYSGNWLW